MADWICSCHRSGSGPKEPTLPYPPPKPFITLNSHKVDSQIGLLRGYYRGKFDKLRESTSSAAPLSIPPIPTPSTINGNGTISSMQIDPPPPAPPFDYNNSAPMSLPDDQPSVLRMKMGPTGQVSVPSAAAASAAAKKKKAAAPADASAGSSGGGSSGIAKAGAIATKTTAKKKPSKSSPKKQPIANGVANGTGVGGVPPHQGPPAILAS